MMILRKRGRWRVIFSIDLESEGILLARYALRLMPAGNSRSSEVDADNDTNKAMDVADALLLSIRAVRPSQEDAHKERRVSAMEIIMNSLSDSLATEMI